MADNIVEILITGDASAAKRAFKDASDSAQVAAGQISKPFELVQQHLASITSLLAGGAFKGAIDATKEWGGEQAGLAKQLQISTEKAAAYQIALKESGLNGDVLVSASDKLTKQLVKNEDAFAKIGVATRNANGSYRSTGEMLPEVITHLQGLHNVTEQNTQGTALFGKSWTEIRGILKLSAEQLDAAQQKAKDLNLVVDPAALKQYKAAMADVHLVTTSLNVQVGTALMPTLTKLASWMGGEGKTASEGIKTAVDAVGEAFLHVYYGAQVAMTRVAGWAAVAGALLSGNLTGARDVMKAMDDDVDALADKWGKAVEKFNAPVKVTGGLGEEGVHTDLTKDKAPKEKKDPDTQLAQYEAELSAKKDNIQKQNDLDGTFYSMSKATEADFWQKKVGLAANSERVNYAVQKKAIDARLSAGKDEFEATLANLQKQEDAIKYDYDAKLAIAEKEVALLRQKYPEKSKEIEKGEEAIQKLLQQKADQTRQIQEVKAEAATSASLAAIDLQEQQAQLEVALWQRTDASMLAEQQGFENRRYAIMVQAAQARAVLSNKEGNVVEKAKIDAQLEQLETQHQARLGKIQGEAAMQQTQLSRNLYANLQNGFANVVSGVLKGTLHMRDVMKQVYSSIADSLATAVAKMVADWLIGEVTKKAATMETSMAQLQAAAANAAGNAYNAIVGIPYVGPFLAPAAAAVAYAGVLAFGSSIGSAEGGWDIGAGVNPVAQLHEKEMVLPAKHADVIRDMADGGAGGGGGNHFHITIQAMDGADAHRVLTRNASSIVAALNAEARKFNRPK